MCWDLLTAAVSCAKRTAGLNVDNAGGATAGDAAQDAAVAALHLTSLKRVREVWTDGCLVLTDACHASAGAAGAHVDAVGRASAAAQAEDADSQREQRC
jgi:hypothetical protein